MSDTWNGHTQGMTIRDILEKVDLFNVSVQNTNNGSQKATDKHLSKDLDGKTIIEVNDPTSAFLGPRLWDKQISFDLGFDLDSDESQQDGGGGGPRGPGGSSGQQASTSASSSSGMGSPMSPTSAVIQQQAVGMKVREDRAGSSDFTSQVMNMEEFLAENGLTLEMEPSMPMDVCSSPESSDTRTSIDTRDVKPMITRPNVIMNVPKIEKRENLSVLTEPSPPSPPVAATAGQLSSKRSRGMSLGEEDEGDDVDDPGAGALQNKPSNDFLYAESKRARLEREKAEKRRKFELEMEFAPEDLALATVPGAQFDPSTRTFDVEELRPQPIIRKRKRIYVSEEAKDDKYWANRVKNNVAARRSREARRLKENQIALRAAFLEKENRILKQELDDVKFDNTKLATERDILKMKLAKYEKNLKM